MTDRKPVVNDEPTVIGGKGTPLELKADDFEDANCPHDMLGHLAYCLMRSHPQHVPAEFKEIDLQTASDETKRGLIAAMHNELGISPFKSNVIVAG